MLLRQAVFVSKVFNMKKQNFNSKQDKMFGLVFLALSYALSMVR